LLERDTHSVESIVKTLSQLEGDIDELDSKVEELKRRLIVHSNEEIERLKQQIITFAENEAKKIVDMAKTEVESDSAAITKESDESLTKIKKNIDSMSDMIVDKIAKMIISGPISPSNVQTDESVTNPVEQIHGK
jgi:V/A-type H+/Na+-transporting ATPase subunit G/H